MSRRAETEYERLRRQGIVQPGPRRVRVADVKVRKERAAERARRNSEARRRTFVVMAHRYPDEVAEVFKAELEGLNKERGPLPGDSQ